MDFNTFLKEQLGYQAGQAIPNEKIPSLREKYNRYIKESQESQQKLEAQQREQQNKAASVQAGLALFESKVNEAQRGGRQLDPNLINAAKNLYGTGQVEQADKISNAIFAPPASTQEQINQIELESKKEEQRLKSEEAINTYYAVVNELDKVKKARKSDLSDVVGPTEFLARPGRAIMAEFGADWAKKNQQLIKDLTMITTSDVLKNVRALAPVTKEDRVFIAERTVPVESDPDNIWDSYLKDKEGALERAKKNLAKKYGINENSDITQTRTGESDQENLSPADRLRAKTQNK
jgi:hypothetical protein